MGRSARKPAVLTLVAVISIAALGAEGEAASPTRPNVLFIITDDQRASGTIEVMPHTRRWFWRGARRRPRSGGSYFPEAVATTPLCCPSRASIFTGRYAHNHGVTNNRPTKLDHSLTLQRYLHDAGYRTGIAGVFFPRWDYRSDPPHFDWWSIFPGGSYDAGAYRVNEADASRPDVTPKVASEYSTTYLLRRARSFLDGSESRDDQPWFLVIAPAAPHLPTIADKPQLGLCEPELPAFRRTPALREADLSDKPSWVSSMQVDRRLLLGDPNCVLGRPGERRKQLRTLVAVDEMVNLVLKRVRDLGESNRTLAFFVSDNGFMWGEHGLQGKLAPYTDSVRIPFFMRWPGNPRVRSRFRDRRLVANIDLAPTAMAAAGLRPAWPMDGVSLLDRRRPRRRLLTEFFRLGRMPGWASLVTRRGQYVEYYDHADAGFRELYDRSADPWQVENLLHSRARSAPPVRADRLAAQLARDRACAGHGELPGRPACP